MHSQSDTAIDIDNPFSLPKAPVETDPLVRQSSQPTSSTELHGYLLMLISTLCFSGMSFLVHLATTRYSFPPITAVLIRGLVHTFLATLYMVVYRPTPTLASLSSSNRLLLVFRGAVGSIDLPLLFVALTLLPVGDTIAIVCTAPVFTLLISHITLKEPISRMELFAAFTCFAGVMLVAQPGSGPPLEVTKRILGSLAAVGGAFAAAVAYVMVRRLGSAVHYMSSVLSFSTATILTSLALGGSIAWADIVRMKHGALLAVWSALFAFAAQCCLNKGLQLCRAGPGTVIRNLDVPVSFFLGLVVLGEKPNWMGVVGSIITVGGTAMIGLASCMRSKI